MSHEFTLWHSQALANARQDNNHDLHKALRTYTPYYRYGFEACEQHYATRIAELEATLTEAHARIAIHERNIDRMLERAVMCQKYLRLPDQIKFEEEWRIHILKESENV